MTTSTYQIVLIFCFSWLSTTFAQSPLIHDESYLDPSFVEFRMKLGEAILNRDTSLLKPLLAEHIVESKDGYMDASPAQFIQSFSEKNGESWELLERISRFGFNRFRTKDSYWHMPEGTLGFQAPSYHWKFNMDSLLLVLGKNVNVRQYPGLSAPTIAQVSYEVLACDCNILTATDSTIVKADGRKWHEVYLPDGRSGYIAYSLTSVSVYRELTVAKLDGEWKIVSFFMAPGVLSSYPLQFR